MSKLIFTEFPISRIAVTQHSDGNVVTEISRHINSPRRALVEEYLRQYSLAYNAVNARPEWMLLAPTMCSLEELMVAVNVHLNVGLIAIPMLEDRALTVKSEFGSFVTPRVSYVIKITRGTRPANAATTFWSPCQAPSYEAACRLIKEELTALIGTSYKYDVRPVPGNVLSSFIAQEKRVCRETMSKLYDISNNGYFTFPDKKGSAKQLVAG